MVEQWMCDFTVWSTTLTAADIGIIMRDITTGASRPISSLFAHYTFNEMMSGTTVLDVSRNGRDGTLRNGATQTIENTIPLLIGKMTTVNNTGTYTWTIPDKVHTECRDGVGDLAEFMLSIECRCMSDLCVTPTRYDAHPFQVSETSSPTVTSRSPTTLSPTYASPTSSPTTSSPTTISPTRSKSLSAHELVLSYLLLSVINTF
jgi:hypothetical protein